MAAAHSTPQALAQTPHDRAQRAARWLILPTFCVIFAYFFQGGGWNQNARFDTIRAVVETGTLDISPYAANTEDISSKDGRHRFANKPPGYALLGVPFYAVLYRGERLLGLDPTSFVLVTANAHALCFVLSGLPGALLVLMIYKLLRDQLPAWDAREAAVAAGLFGLGTLVLPFSGLLVPQILVSACLFGAWLLLAWAHPGIRAPSIVGLLVATAVACDYTVVPLAGLYMLAVWQARGWRSVAAFLVGPIVWVAVLLACNYASFGQFLVTNNTYQNQLFSDKHLFLGMFGWPKLNVLYWITLHPMRGLFYCNPILLLALPGAVLVWRQRTLKSCAWIPPAVIGYHLLINLCFNGWTGGWGVGPRYLVPALPFIFVYAAPALRRWPRLSLLPSLVSVVVMLVVTAVLVMSPANLEGPPPADALYPVGNAFAKLRAGQVSISRQSMLDAFASDKAHQRPTDPWASYNLGELIGLSGPWSLLPCVMVIAAFFAAAARLPRSAASESATPPAAASS